jgi:chromate reductase
MSDGSILIVSGTNRPGCNALRVARVLERHYQAAGVAGVEVFPLTELPGEVFQGSAYATKPPAMGAIQRRVVAARGLHVVTPEYNGSFPGVLKYFIDMLKFPESFERKPVAFTGEAAGTWGGLRPVEHLAAIFAYRNAHLYPDRVFIPGVNGRLDADGNLTDAAIDERLAKQAAGFAQFARLFPAATTTASTKPDER